MAAGQCGNRGIKKLSKGGGRYVEPSYFLFIDTAQKAGLSVGEIEDWTPGMIFDLVYFKANTLEEEKAPKPPDQSYFDNF